MNDAEPATPAPAEPAPPPAPTPPPHVGPGIIRNDGSIGDGLSVR